MKSAAKCGCDEANQLRAELAVVTAERDYLLTGVDLSELRVMRQELGKAHENDRREVRDGEG